MVVGKQNYEPSKLGRDRKIRSVRNQISVLRSGAVVYGVFGFGYVFVYSTKQRYLRIVFRNYQIRRRNGAEIL